VELRDAVRDWSPGDVTRTARLDGEPLVAFAALLDQPAPAAADGDPLPVGWHWFSFLDRPATAELGHDGHPLEGAFLPPLPHRRRMFAGGRLAQSAPLRVGDTVTRTTAVAGTTVKEGRSGEMLFVTVRSTFTRDAEQLLVEEQDLVYRSEPPGTARPGPVTTAPGPVAPVTAGEAAVEVTPDAPLLFRFSALTYNAHRIHYDEPYATGVEGHAGLVVHGPLLALLLLEVPRRHHPHRPVDSFSYRLTRPAHAGTPVRATGRVDGDTVALHAAAGDAAPSITGTAVLGGDRSTR
jgi:3-methylfumaryl-CoA hydratase